MSGANYTSRFSRISPMDRTVVHSPPQIASGASSPDPVCHRANGPSSRERLGDRGRNPRATRGRDRPKRFPGDAFGELDN